ncbi:hypothetical protein J3458_009139 [Metarhizium acridum]|uniref:Uncharacterized protein n=1 Tax=Metarhizium acridum (strain CQMa 102) TaxID=655827 RepID=E9E664_METAQ|nr:uncharacterized protein MAC_05362 [Metarhizium acridum CQMa 102]EFY88597.1 hypothetical protein MAC_05362 [Metarhizium acridum CQMa 102]KAG8415278.1 hypothetical protein J3458_009139 [Metarhizium acridum]
MTKRTSESDAFLPSGAIDIPTNDASIGGAASHSAFDASQPTSTMSPSGDAFSNHCNGQSVSSPSRHAAIQSPPVLNPPSANRSHFNFPLAGTHLDTPSPLNLSNSTSPVAAAGTAHSSKGRVRGYFHPNSSSLSPPAAWDFGGASLARSVSADAAIPPQTPSRLYTGLAGHSSLVENWRLERGNLEALRRKAERLYRDQQSVIDEMSEEWLNERKEMSHLIQGLRERIQRLEGENTVLKKIASYTTHIPGLISPHNSVQSGSGEAFVSHSPSLASNKSPPPRLSGRSAGEALASFDLPPGLDGASRRPHQFAKQGGSPCTSPTAAPAHATHIPISPRIVPRKSIATDFLSISSPEPNKGVPIIDIQEIDPKLEGIPIRATAVKKSTFHAASNRPSNIPRSLYAPEPATGTRKDNHLKQKTGNSIRERLRLDRLRCGLTPLASSKDQTKQILATDESRRLTMHAGHTPNHSLSLFPTMTATESSSAAARSQETTPTAGASSGFADHHEDTDLSDDSDGKLRHGEEDNGEGNQDGDRNDDDIEGYLEPSDDVALKGPLMVKNIPAQDEIFWAQVNQRLDPISRGQDALPRVLQSPELEAVQNLLPTALQPPPEEGGKQEAGADLESDEEGEDGKASVEPDVPLRFKNTFNFGAPFGST